MRLRLFALAMLAAPPCLAQTVSTASTGSVAELVPRVVERVAQVAEENYVFPDTGRMVAEHLRRRLRAGAFTSVSTPAQLADRLTLEMRAVNGDRHLYVNLAGSSATAGGVRMVRRRPGEAPSDEALVWPRRMNYDFTSLQRLAGNVGYLSLSALSSRGSDEAFRAVDAAMAFLAHVDAMIIDLRSTVGGEPRMSDYLASYFFEGAGTPTLTSTSRAMDQTIERATVRVNGTHRPGIPVFLLVGPGTASGTEDFAFIMKQSGRATLVGGRTAGAGRLTATYPVGDGFVASVSGGRTFDPRTGKEWERIGIEPHVQASQDEALTVAHAAAIERVALSTRDSVWKGALQWTRRAVLARARPYALAAKVLRGYAGDYDQRVVRFDQGKLWYQRDASRPREELTPVDERTFALGEATRVEFVLERESVVALKVIAPTGQELIYPRTN
jgi:hypothetical protein